MIRTFSCLSWRHVLALCFMLFVSAAEINAQTNPASITVSGGCLTAPAVLTLGATVSGKPTYVGKATVALDGGTVTNAPFGISVYPNFNWTAFVNISQGATTDPFDGDDGQPYLHTTSATDLPPASGWTYGPMFLCQNYSTFAVQYPSSAPSSLTVSATPSTASVCAGSSVTLTASATGGSSPYTYVWTAPANATFVGAATGSQVVATVGAGASGTLSFSVTATDAGVNQSSVGSNAQARVATRASSTLSGTATVAVTVNANPVVTITPSATTIVTGQSVTLTASGADSYSWSTGSNLTAVTVTPSQLTTYTVTGSSNGCVGQATATVTTTCTDASAQAISTTVLAELGPGNCSVKINGTGFGTTMVLTGPENYVYSTVYRRAGTYVATANVTKPGTYTFTVKNANACGQVFTDTRTFIVSGTACQ